MWKITINNVLIIVAVVLLFGLIASLFSNNPNIAEIKPEIKINESGKSNASVINSDQNTTNIAKNMISIPLEKPPFIKD